MIYIEVNSRQKSTAESCPNINAPLLICHSSLNHEISSFIFMHLFPENLAYEIILTHNYHLIIHAAKSTTYTGNIFISFIPSGHFVDCLLFDYSPTTLSLLYLGNFFLKIYIKLIKNKQSFCICKFVTHFLKFRLFVNEPTIQYRQHCDTSCNSHHKTSHITHNQGGR